MALTKMASHKNDISQLTLLSRVLVWPLINLEAIATLNSGQRDNFEKVSIYFVHHCPQKGKPQRVHCPLKAGKSLYFNSNLIYKNACRYLYSAKEVSSKTDETQVSQPHPNVCILHSYQIFSRLQKIGETH